MPLKYDECLQELYQVLKIDPNNSKALYRKASVLKSLGRSEESLETIQVYFDSVEASKTADDASAATAKSKSQQADIKLFNQLKAEVKKQMAENEVKVSEMAKRMIEGGADKIDGRAEKLADTEE